MTGDPICPVCVLGECDGLLEAMTFGIVVAVAQHGDAGAVYLTICEEHRPSADEAMNGLLLKYRQLQDRPS